MRSFERVTAPKTDKWLVHMVGLLAATIGAALLVAAAKEEMDEATLTLAVASACSFAGVDVIYAARRQISPIYLADGLVEMALALMLLSHGDRGCPR
jgi:hypothetical protein